MKWKDKYFSEPKKIILDEKIQDNIGKDVYIVSLNNDTNVAINIDNEDTIKISITDIKKHLKSQENKFFFHHKGLLAKPKADIQGNQVGYISKIKENGKNKLVTIKKEGSNYVIYE
jgi:hypothetical protein